MPQAHLIVDRLENDQMAKSLLLLASLTLTVSPLHAHDYTSRTFRKLQLTDKFWSEGTTFADINRDGHNDIIAGPYWYEGPDFKRRHEFYPATKTFTSKHADGTETTIAGFDGGLGSGTLDKDTFEDNFYVTTYDFNRDGWPDILVVGFPGTDASWYENPGKDELSSNTFWKRHVVADGVDNQSIEFVDFFGNGRPVLVCMHGGKAGYFSPANNAASKWTFHAISETSDEFQWYTHGLGYGDVNGDGRNDILHSDGWWEQPVSLAKDPVWQYHPYPFHLGPNQIKLFLFARAADPEHLGVFYDAKVQRHVYGILQYPLKGVAVADVSPDGIPEYQTIYGGSHMSVYDVNGDGLADVVTSIVAHGYGLVWWEQLKTHDRFGGPEFRRHIIINREPSENKYGVEFSEMQAVTLFDIDGDGLKDIITGKRFWGHGNGTKVKMDPESNAPAVLYWFKQVHNADGTVDFIPHLIDDHSGAGTQITVGDVNGDGLPDILVANKNGAFVFFQEVTHVTKEQWEAAEPKILFPTHHTVARHDNHTCRSRCE